MERKKKRFTNPSKKAKYFLVVSLATYIGIEAICFLFITTGYIPAAKPSFKLKWTIKDYPLQVADIDSIWGAWHYPGTHKYQKDCFNITYSINSYGARDAERSKKSDSSERVVVLGDSFMEGYGVPVENRLSNILEQKTSIEFMNFACSNFGLTQEYLVYKHLASTFDHSTVLIGFLPFNDFRDDNPDNMSNTSFKRYRPYFLKGTIGYSLAYNETTLTQSTLTKESFAKTENTLPKKLIRLSKSYSFWGNILSYFRYQKITKKEKNEYSYYYNYTEDEANRFYFIIQKIKETAKDKRIILLAIPTTDDINAYKKKGGSPLSVALINFCKREGVELIDLLPILSAQNSNLYLSCDGHWNSFANNLVANYVAGKFK